MNNFPGVGLNSLYFYLIFAGITSEELLAANVDENNLIKAKKHNVI